MCCLRTLITLSVWKTFPITGLSLMDMPSVVHPDILAMGGKVEFWEREGGGVCAEMYFNPKGGALRIQRG